MTAHVCVEQGCGLLTNRGPRCIGHQRQREQLRGTRQQRGLGADHQRLRKQCLAEQPWCARCHATTDLTADHIKPRSQGGQNVRENYQTLCGTCNRSKGGR